MKKKILGILVVTLLIATALPAVGLINEKNISNIQDMSSASTDIVWSDNFDSYVLGQYLDGTPDDGGWQSWANNPAWGAYVVDDQAYSSPHSVEIIGVADIIHEFTGLRSGNWTFIDYVYVPSTYYAGSYMFFLSYYKAVPEDWFNQFGITFDGNNGYVYNFDSYDPDEKLPLIIDQWVEIRVEIDFESDWFECYYNDELLMAQNWTYGYGGIHDTGFLNFAGIDLCWGYGDSPVYHDDMSIDGEGTGLTPNLQCDGSLSWTCKKGETVTGKFTVENIGNPNSRLEWLVDESPDYGSDSWWEFDPLYGKLTPDDGEFTVTVTLKAPNTMGDYDGVIKIVAVGDPDDYCEIPISFKVSRNKEVNTPFLQFLEQYPILYPLLQRFLRL